MQPNKPKKKRTWLWVIIALVVFPFIVSIFTDNDEKKGEPKDKIEAPKQTKEEWTASLMEDLNIQKEYLDSIPLRLKNTKSIDMLRGYAHDVRNIANKTITDSSYMDVYTTPEVSKLMSDNSAKAKKIQPEVMQSWRALYVKNLGDKLWEDNIYVECPNGGTTITFIGGIFANNKNIKQWEEQIESQLADMGFKQVRYKWIKHDTEYTYYDIQ